MNLSRKVILLTSMFLLAQPACITTRSSMEAEEEKKEVQQGIADLRKGKADLESQLSQAQEDSRSVVGRIEVIEKNLSDAAAAKEAKALEEQEKVTKEQEKLDLLVESMTKLQDQLNLLTKNFEDFKKKSVSKSRKSKTNSKKLGNYQQAETDFAKKKWREAALGYQKYRELNPKGRRYQRATYRMGVCFRNLKMKDEAQVFFEELVSNFKPSKYTKLASAELKKLK